MYTDNSSPWADWRKCAKGQYYSGCELNPGTVSCDEERASRMRSCTRETIPLDQVDKWNFNSKAGILKCNIKFKHHC